MLIKKPKFNGRRLVFMTVMDKMNAGTRMVFNSVFDKEPINFMESAALYSTVATGRYNLAMLEVMYNHAVDPDLRELVKQAIDEQSRHTVNDAETLIKRGGGQEPSQHLKRRELHHQALNIPADAKLTDREIAMTLVMFAKFTQVAVLGALQQCYQLELAKMFRDRLDSGLDYNYRLMQLMLNKGWLPFLEKVEH
jgi:hypothetical protein